MNKETLQEHLIVIMISIWTMITPLLVPFLLIGVFDAIDFVVGVRASRKLGQEFTISKAMQRTADKLTWQGASLIVTFLIQHFFIKDIPIFQGTYVGIIVIQLQSIREKIKILSGVDVLKDTVNYFKKKN